MAVFHAIRNAQDATEANGSVSVSLSNSTDECCITVSDTGCGMDEIFMRERLFKPFDSTKGTQGMGVGAYQIRETIRAAGGDVRVNSTPGQGTELIFELKTVD